MIKRLNPNIIRVLRGALCCFFVSAVGLVHEAAGAIYYVNDDSTNGTFFTSAPGNDANSGTTNNAPKRTLTNLLASVSLSAGDLVYIDTGTYSGYTASISISGTAGNPIRFLGAPQQGGTVLDRGDMGATMLAVSGSHLVFEDLTVKGANRGIQGSGSSIGVIFRGLVVRDNSDGFHSLSSPQNWIVENTIIANNSRGARWVFASEWRNCVFWNNGVDIADGSSLVALKNSVVVGGTAFTFTPSGDYNVFWNTAIRENQIAYLEELGQPNSTYSDPGLTDPTNLDFTPLTNSILIDFGDPLSAGWTNEPAPNGGRINAGVFGGTTNAVASPTNRWVQVLTFNDGGAITGGTSNLRWNYGAFNPGDTVAVQYSPDAGVSWSNIATGVAVTNRVQAWNVTGLPSMSAFWRVQSEDDLTVVSRSSQRIAVNGFKVPYYVNDGVSSDDVYTTQVGSDANDGLTPATPMASITNAFASYNFGGHQILYVDTGSYSNYTITVGSRQAGSASSGRFTIRGSTNIAAGGSVFNRNNPAQRSLSVSGPRVDVEHVTLRGGSAVAFSGGNHSLRYITIEDMAGESGRSVNLGATPNVAIENSIITGNTTAGIRISSTPFSISRSVMKGFSGALSLEGSSAVTNTMVNNVVFMDTTVFAAQAAQGDNNILWNATVGGIFPSLNSFQKTTDSWWNSAVLDPQFADASEGVFHPLSVTGRYDLDLETFVQDMDHSPVIDFGQPASTAWTNEPAPNGERINAGAFGGSVWASQSRTNAWLQALTYNGGGTLNAPEGDDVYWAAGNFPTGATVRVELSADGGISWAVAASNLSAQAGVHGWTYTNQASTTSALWRVVYESDTNVLSATDNTFTFQNGPFVYYLNDASLAGDVYTTAIGSDTNPGISPATPKRTLNALLSAHVLQPGDVVYIDTGTYTLSANQTISAIHSGSSNNVVNLLGSTNLLAGGTVFDRNSLSDTAYALHIQAGYVGVSDITTRSGGVGIRINGVSGTRLQRVRVENARGSGIQVINAPSTRLRHVVARNSLTNGVRVSGSSSSVSLENSVLWENVHTGLRVASGSVFMTNSVVAPLGPQAYGLWAATTNSIKGDYNAFFLRDDARVGYLASLNRPVDVLPAWLIETGQEAGSLQDDPLFVDPDGNDFHLKSGATEGRFLPGVGFVTDPVTSPLINAGDPSYDASEETGPGNRINIGLHGNTPEASKGRSIPQLYAASMRQGGWVEGQMPLHWVARNLATTDYVAVEWSPNGGETWEVLHTGVTVSAETFVWDTTAATSTVAGIWRVSSVAQPTVTDQTTNFFGVRNGGALAWYVNDTDLADDVFTSGPGNPTNWVATSDRPLPSLATVFARYDLEPGDSVYVDTGSYTESTPIVMGPKQSGLSGAPLSIVGSTNCVVHGPVISVSGGIGIHVRYAEYVNMTNLVVSGGAQGVHLDHARHITLSGLRSLGSSSAGFLFTVSSNIVMAHSVAMDGLGSGVRSLGSKAVNVNHSVLWSNRLNGVYLIDSQNVSVSNSVITAHTTTNYIYRVENSYGFSADYNNVRRGGSADFALDNGVLRKILTRWQSFTSNDVHSLTQVPLFVDPAGGDFHLQSEEGRYNPATCAFVSDATTSALIDAGAPGAPFAHESAPNGARVNIGLHGNTPQASRTPAAPRLTAVSLYSGGVIRGTNDLYWVATGAATGHMVRVEYRPSNDTNWVVIATNLSAAAGTFADWDTAAIGTVPSTLWRVVSENNPAVVGSNAVPFQINNGQLTYYVNNDSTDGNVYTTAAGDPLFDGLDPATPLPSLQAVLSRYPLGPGDRILIDTGIYPFNSTVTFGALEAGEGTNTIKIVGSTNLVAGGTVINHNKGGPSLRFVETEGYEVSHLVFTNSSRGIEGIELAGSSFENITMDFPSGLSLSGERYGFKLEDSTGIRMNRVALSGLTNGGQTRAVHLLGASSLEWENGVLWSNRIGFNVGGSSSLTWSNSVLAVWGEETIGINLALGGTVAGDFNALYARNGALAVRDTIRFIETPSLTAPVEYSTLSSWRIATGNEIFSLSHDPLFANPGERDFFLKSQAGRYSPDTDSFETDGETSPLIDAGNASSVFANEPAPNGGRRNIGLHGNSLRASKTPTNAALTVVSFNDGGVAQGTNIVLHWLARGAATNGAVNVRVSYNGGGSWTTLANAISATNRSFAWDTTSGPSSLTTRWRVEKSTSPNSVFATNELMFVVRNTNFVFYVNDMSTNGAVYTTAPGSSGNDGLSPATPLSSVSEVLANYNVEPGDTIYVDTGVYDTSDGIRIQQEDAGEGSNHVYVIGSTNQVDGGTVFSGGGIRLEATRGITIENLTIDMAGLPGGTGIDGIQATNVLIRSVEVIGGGAGFTWDDSIDIQMIHSIARNAVTNGIHSERSQNVEWDHGVLWSNRTAVSGSGISLRNSILGAFGSTARIYSGAPSADYNALHVQGGAMVGSVEFDDLLFPVQTFRVGNWVMLSGQDQNSMAYEPYLANPAAGDFHLRTVVPNGRVLPNGATTSDAVTSPLIDAGDPSSAFAEEPAPNGGRVNIGRYGNTTEASLSPTNAALYALSLSDGGTIRTNTTTLRWLAQGDAVGHSYRVEYSLNDGQTWTLLADGLSAGTSEVAWDVSTVDSTVLARWRVISETDTNVVGDAETVFAIRNGPIPFYINNGDTNGNVYTTSPGDQFNTGTSPNDPKDSINDLLAAYDIEPGDIIYVDTGVYTLNEPVEISNLDDGSQLQGLFVTIKGSTNELAGGTVFNATAVSPAIRLNQAEWIALQHLTVTGAGTAISVSESRGYDFRHLRLENGGTGVTLGGGSQNGRFSHTLIRNMSGTALSLGSQGARWEHGVLWSNGSSGSAMVTMSAGTASFSNSVFAAFGNTPVFSWNANAIIQADYNLYYLNDDAFMAQRIHQGAPLPVIAQNLSRWVRRYGVDENSVAGDPLFADPGNGDFHPRSTAGRYDPTTGTFVMTDTNTSFLVDSASPFSPFGNESAPAGNRANIGIFGNTAHASRSPNDSRLVAISLRDGGRVEGSAFRLRWRAYGPITGETVRVEFSDDAGAVWTALETGIVARAESIFWDTTEQPSTWIGLWRVVSEVNTNVYGVGTVPFAVRNDPLALYVNNASTNENVYTTVVGDPGNNGLTPATPRDSLQSLLDDYDLEPGDTIYMDTGNYIIDSTITWGRFDAWDEMTDVTPLSAGGTSVTLQGSTNEVSNGTRITRVSNGTALELVDAYGVNIRHIRFNNIPVASGTGLRLLRSPYALIEWVRTRDASVGIEVQNTEGDVRLRNSVLVGSGQYGLRAAGSEDIDFQYGVLWSNQVGALVIDGDLRVYNSVIGVLRSEWAGFERQVGGNNNGILDADYNVFKMVQGAFVGRLLGPFPGGELPSLSLVRWNERSGQDANSLSITDQVFADPDAGDFHPLSPYGRYIPGTGLVTNNAEQLSPLIDGARPQDPFNNEPAFNGQRANIGVYGNTSEASKSPTNGLLRALTFNDGGSGFDDITLRWTASGDATGHLLSLEFTRDGGATWELIDDNVPASAESYVWDSAPFGRAVAGLWRLTSQTDTNVTDTTDEFFALRQDGSVPYYVNTPTSSGDVYTTAPGNDNNNGFLPETPKATLQNLIDLIELEPGDVVYVDTGVYAKNEDIVISILDAGVSNNPVIFRGSTNIVGGGTVIDRITESGSAIRLDQTQGIQLENFHVRNANRGVNLIESRFITLDKLRVEDNADAGVRVAGSRDVRVQNSILNNNTGAGITLVVEGLVASEASIEHAVVWGSPWAVNLDVGSIFAISNSVLRVSGADSRIFRLGLGVSDIRSDYNNIIRAGGAVVAERTVTFGGNEFFPRLLDWQRDFGQDTNSLSHAPAFNNAPNGDFHLQSIEGRWDGVDWVQDAVHSPMIDTGSPDAEFEKEPSPNGGRVNIGRYGNTDEASLSETNPWVRAISVNDGGVVSGTQRLYWATGNMASTDTVRVEFAADGVDFLDVLLTNIPVSVTDYEWDASGETVTQNAKWRVVSENHVDTQDLVDIPFTVKNQILTIYVNDGDTNATVFTTAAGSSSNDGLSPSEPLDNPAEAVAMYPVGPGDVIYIDTGNYSITETEGIRLGLIGDTLKSGIQGLPVTILGSTNYAAGGSRLVGNGANSSLLTVRSGRDVHVHDLIFENADAGVHIANSEAVLLNRIRVRETKNGFLLNNALGVDITQSASSRNTEWGFLISGSFSDIGIHNSVASSNALGAISVGSSSSLFLRNSIIDVAYPGALAYSVPNQGNIDSDFNMIWKGTNTVFARNPQSQVNYRNLRAWQRARDVDHFSVMDDPRFVDPAGGNFRLQSEVGRFDPSNSVFVTDVETSWAIDAGAFEADASLEPEPNGGRLNLGMYGNTAQSSMSITNANDAALKIVSVSDGGTIAGVHPVYWLSRGLPSNDVLTLEYTPNNGVDWITVATNVPVTSAFYDWDLSEEDSTPLGLLRLVSESLTNVLDQTTENFTIRNTPIPYYVNVTNAPTGDIYTTAAGDPNNNGITPATPLDSILEVIQRYELVQGDTIYVDTGTYLVEEDIRILADDSGVATNRIVIRGSTNFLGGGTVLFRTTNNIPVPGDPSVAFDLFGAQHLEISHFTIENAGIGVRLGASQPTSGNNLLRNVLVRDGASAGISISSSSANIMDRVVVTRFDEGGIQVSSAGGTRIDRSVIWSNKGHAVSLSSASLAISNSVLHAMDSRTNVIFNLSDTASVQSDYNALFAVRGASYAQQSGFLLQGVPQWTAFSGQDRHSVATDPLFADPANDDYHLLSEAGRYVLGDGWVTNDVVTSLLIDSGSPGAGFSNEPAPNGTKRNIGLHGDTDQASKSRSAPRLLPITAMAGGRMQGILDLYWSYFNLAPTNRVRLDISLDLGDTWETIGSSIPITEDGFLWDSLEDAERISPISKWRIVLEADTNIVGETDTFFGLNAPFIFYVNDDSLSNNLYTTAVGDDANLGIFPDAPKQTLLSVLNNWDLSPEDVILFDTGTYPYTTNSIVQITVNSQGAPGKPVTIRGSTNAPGAWFDATMVGAPFLEITANHIELEELNILNGIIEATGTNVVIQNMYFTNSTLKLSGRNATARDLLFEDGGLEVTGDDATVSRVDIRDGSVTISGARALLQNSAISQNAGTLLTISGTNTSVRNNTIVGGRVAVRQEGQDSSLDLRNNILIANAAHGADAIIIERIGGTLNSDYNLLLPRNNAWIGNADEGLWERVLYWQQRSGQDEHSFSADPLFADEANRNYRIKSSAGRYDEGVFVMDAQDSPALDAGDPLSDFGEETVPNGNRVNIGAYGNTVQASRTPQSPWLVALTFNDGGAIRSSDMTLYWLAGGMSPTNTVTLEYSPDNGATWTNIASGISVFDGTYFWEASQEESGLRALWRVVLDADAGVSDENDEAFSVRNDVNAFYVSTTSTVDNVYATAPGDAGNDGRSPSTPMDSIQSVLSGYDTVGGDVIYVDTGVYISPTEVRAIWSRGGDAVFGPVTIQGSTNYSAGGTVIHRTGGARGFNINASHFTIRDIAVRNTGQGFRLTTNSFVTIERSASYDNAVGVSAEDIWNATFRNLRIWNNSEGGINLNHSRTTLVQNVTFVSNLPFSVRTQGEVKNNRLENNIYIVPSATNGVAMAGSLNLTNVFVDYNIYHLESPSTIFGATSDLRTWQLSTGNDFRSALTNPLLSMASSGDFYLQSAYGRYDPSVNAFVTNDLQTSWAIGRGNPAMAFDQQPEPTAGRINLGAFGNTVWASKGSTNEVLLTRSLNATNITIGAGDNIQPLIWAVNWLPDDLLVAVQFSGDGGDSWFTLETNVNVYQEFVVQTNTPFFNTFNGFWRIIGEKDATVYSVTNANPFEVVIGEFDRIRRQFLSSGQQGIEWRGAWNEAYRVEYTDDGLNWTNAPSGPGLDEQADFISERGGDLRYIDIESPTNRFRSYRVFWDQDP